MWGGVAGADGVIVLSHFDYPGKCLRMSKNKSMTLTDARLKFGKLGLLAKPAPIEVAHGGKVEFIEPGADSYRMFDTPEKIGRMVLARFSGRWAISLSIISSALMDCSPATRRT